MRTKNKKRHRTVIAYLHGEARHMSFLLWEVTKVPQQGQFLIHFVVELDETGGTGDVKVV